MLRFFTIKRSNFITALTSIKAKKTASNQQLLQTYAELHVAELFRIY